MPWRALPNEIPDAFWKQFCIDADHPMACVDLDNTFVWVNGAFERLVGYSIAELIGKTWMEITSQPDVGGDLASVRSVLERKIDHYRMVKEYIHKRGHLVQIELIVRRFPANVLEDLAYFRVEAPPVRATPQELHTLRRDLVATIDQLRSQLDSKGVHVNTNIGDHVGGDKTGRDKTTNSTALVIAVVAAVVSITVLVAWIAYFAFARPGQTPPPQPQSIPVLEEVTL